MNLSVYPSVCLLSVHLSDHPSLHSPVCAFAHLCIYYLAHSFHPSIHLPSIHLTNLPRTSYVTSPMLSPRDGEMIETQFLSSKHCPPSLGGGLGCPRPHRLPRSYSDPAPSCLAC